MSETTPERSEHLAKLWSLIKDVKVAMLTSWDGHRLRSRPMYGHQDVFAGELRFFTHLDSGKVDEMAHFDQVCLAYADPQQQTYVAVSGRAKLTRDRALIEKHWNSMTAAWFPKGMDEPDLGMIVVEVEEAEYWDSTTSKMRYLWETAKANLTGSLPNVGDHERVEVVPSPARG